MLASGLATVKGICDLKIDPMALSKPRIQNLPRQLKPYFLALFRPGERWNQTEGAEDLPARQLAFMRTQFEAGTYRIAGPITEGAITAMAIIEADDLQTAENLARQDPAVETARLTVEVHPAFLPALDALQVEFDK